MISNPIFVSVLFALMLSVIIMAVVLSEANKIGKYWFIVWAVPIFGLITFLLCWLSTL